MYKITSLKDNIIDNYYYSNLKDVYIIIIRLKSKGCKITVNKIKK